MNILSALDARKRTLGVGSGQMLQPGMAFAPFIARKLKKYARLDVHNGCVNRLRWHKNGRTLASVSDDHTIAISDVHNLEDPLEGEEGSRVLRTNSIGTQHDGNIFGVCFLASSRILATGARDSRVCLTDVTERRGLSCYMCHDGSVKHTINDGVSDFVFMSASVDGTVRQFDVREPHNCQKPCRNVIISLARASATTRSDTQRQLYAWTDFFGTMDVPEAMDWIDLAHRESQWASQHYDSIDIKAIAVNPIRTELIAVAASDNLVRIFDRRKMSLQYATNDGVSVNYTTPELDSICLPRHFWSDESRVFSTYVAWSPNGETLAVTYENEHVYLFDRHFKGVNAVKTTKATRCHFEMISKEDHTSNRIGELEAHVPRCDDSACLQRNLPKLLYLLLIRNNTGDALLCEHLARKAFMIDPSDPILLFRRIQACLALDNFYFTRKLCRRGARLFPQHASHFEKIRKMCLLLLDEKVRDLRFQEITLSLKSICKCPNITSPGGYRDVYTVPDTVNEDEDSDDELHVSISTNLRYATRGWRRWPCLETCLMLEEYLSGSSGGVIQTPAPPSDSDTVSDEELIAFDYESELALGNYSLLEVHMQGAIDFSNRDKTRNVNHYITYELDSGCYHRFQPGLLYDRFPMILEPEHSLYAAIEDPQWRPVSDCRRFFGHCNFGTDIAEVGFWGNDVLLTGSANGAIYLYDIKTGRIIDILKGHSENVNCVQVNEQGTLLASSGLDNFVQIWRPMGKTQHASVSFEAHIGAIYTG
ncbi:WD domain, G-beta repeat containing protein [Babesia divergens]|uniref:WD domain, G-beta repeat containing protein n=1 Tax=Babesia divergens TaxID=32595 RepID=A0AAD9GAT4_BABDI|nr:WD domain, G-beta repeat containing protein [Babesia divergens]